MPLSLDVVDAVTRTVAERVRDRLRAEQTDPSRLHATGRRADLSQPFVNASLPV